MFGLYFWPAVIRIHVQTGIKRKEDKKAHWAAAVTETHVLGVIIIHDLWCNCRMEEPHSLAAQVWALLEHRTEMAQSFFLVRNNKWSYVAEHREIAICQDVKRCLCAQNSPGFLLYQLDISKLFLLPADLATKTLLEARQSHLQHIYLNIGQRGGLQALVHPSQSLL